MEPRTVRISDLFAPNTCVIIPRYQRRYSWDEKNAHSLIRDIAEVTTSSGDSDHWTGVIIYREVRSGAGRCDIGQQDFNHICREVIDGQQRLTTIRLWLKALLDVAKANGTPIPYELSTFYLQSPNDQEFQAILNDVDVSQRDDKISRVYTYFRYLLWLGEAALLDPEPEDPPKGKLRGDSAEARWQDWLNRGKGSGRGRGSSVVPLLTDFLTNTTGRLTFLGLQLDAHDEPERIFSALNGNRTELSQFDHARNWVFNSVPQSTRDDLFDKHWKPAEDAFDTLQVKRRHSRDFLKSLFLYDYLISLGEGSQGQFNASRSFSALSRYWRSNRSTQLYGSLEDWLTRDLQDEIALWKAQREDFTTTNLPSGKSLKLTDKSRRSLHRIRRISDGPPAPLVLWLLRRSLTDPSDPRHFTSGEVEQALSRLEGYMFKTLLGGGTLTNMRSEIIGSMARIDRECQAAPPTTAAVPLLNWIDKMTTVRWARLRPDLENAHQRGPGEGVYDCLPPGAPLALLDALEEALAGRASRGFLPNKWEHGADPYSVEHIFPQKDKKWKSDLKAWRVVESDMQDRLHVLGNLTAVETNLNQKLNNKTFQEKVDLIALDPAAAASKLQAWTGESRWTSQEIDDRTHEYVKVLMKMWPDPS